MRTCIACILFLLFQVGVFAQGFHFGLKGGLTYGGLMGDEENIENQSFGTGFTFGVHSAYGFNSVFGVKAELAYVQLNHEQNIEGNSNFNFLQFQNTEGTSVALNGQRNQGLNFTRSYLYLPLSVYGLFWERLELFGGLQVGYALSARSAGDVTFRANSVPEFSANLDYNYFTDKPGEYFSEEPPRQFGSIVVHDELGAYYEVRDAQEDLFKRLDYGVHAGLSFFISSSLYVGGKIMYGLADITESSVDRSYQPVGLGQNIETNDDKDRNIGLDVSLGFRF